MAIYTICLLSLVRKLMRKPDWNSNNEWMNVKPWTDPLYGTQAWFTHEETETKAWPKIKQWMNEHETTHPVSSANIMHLKLNFLLSKLAILLIISASGTCTASQRRDMDILSTQQKHYVKIDTSKNLVGEFKKQCSFQLILF